MPAGIWFELLVEQDELFVYRSNTEEMTSGLDWALELEEIISSTTMSVHCE